LAFFWPDYLFFTTFNFETCFFSSVRPNLIAQQPPPPPYYSNGDVNKSITIDEPTKSPMGNGYTGKLGHKKKKKEREKKVSYQSN
jgi:hypothetical protein